VVDFSFHGAVKGLLDYCVEHKLPVVVATTGHTEEEKALIAQASKSIPVFFSANMSVGIAVTADLARKAAAAFPDADIEIVETHHNRKVDVPSGTALLLADSIRQARPQSVYNIGRPENGKRTKEEIGIHSLRIGNVVGIHEILISTGNETITIKHECHSRDLFAEGALRAAAFICGKGPGLYNMKDMIG
jgi:4-hydroxy-tetrahydrodipicolinate reductase